MAVAEVSVREIINHELISEQSELVVLKGLTGKVPNRKPIVILAHVTFPALAIRHIFLLRVLIGLSAAVAALVNSLVSYTCMYNNWKTSHHILKFMTTF